MNAYKTEVVLNEAGQLSLQGLPFVAGDTVEVIVLELAKNGHIEYLNGGDVQDDVLDHILDEVDALPPIDGAPTDWAENFDAYRFGLKKADDA